MDQPKAKFLKQHSYRGAISVILSLRMSGIRSQSDWMVRSFHFTISFYTRIFYFSLGKTSNTSSTVFVSASFFLTLVSSAS